MFARLRCGGNLPLCVWHSVPERATYGTEYACRAQKGFLGYATHFQRPAEQSTPQTVDSLLPTGRIFSARNGPRSEVSRHKKRVYSLEMSWNTPSFFIATL